MQEAMDELAELLQALNGAKCMLNVRKGDDVPNHELYCTV